MNLSTAPLSNTAPADADMAEQVNSALVSGGVMAGAAAVAAICVAVAGPVGTLVGASLGSVVRAGLGPAGVCA